MTGGGPTRWVVLVTGVLAVVVGAVLLADATAPSALFYVLAGVGLLAAGIARASGPGWPVAWLERVVGVLAAVLGVVVLSWHGLSVDGLAVGLGIIFVADAVGHVLVLLLGHGSRIAAALGLVVNAGLAALVFGWSAPTTFVIGALCAAWLVFTGIRAVAVVPGAALPTRGRPMLARTAVGLLAAGVGLTGALTVHRADPKIVPSTFYTPPLAVPHEPGRLIRSEEITAGVPSGDRGWKILYTTTDSRGAATVASGAVLAPAGTPASPRPVVAVAHATTGIATACPQSTSPSDPFGGGPPGALRTMVTHGWVGVSTDFAGLGTAGPTEYLVGPAEGHATLDAVRAARALPGLSLSDSTVLWGHSQGGHAVLWAGSLAPRYAPNVHVLGVAAMAPATDLFGQLTTLDRTPLGLVIESYIAQDWHEVFGLPLQGIIPAGSAETVEQIAGKCLFGSGQRTAEALASSLNGPVLPPVPTGQLADLLRRNTPQDPITAPVLIAQGSVDTIVPAALQRTYVGARCAAGQALDYREFPGLDHLPLVAANSPLVPRLEAWTIARLAGEPARNTC
jgi:alpha-beta hydrolase superfamily lysophospholipase/uncharacterized membrane protein HdeD (DUF308 family)